jgi:hypothetical protein
MSSIMFDRKQFLTLLFVAGGGVVGWLLHEAADDPPAQAAVQPAMAVQAAAPAPAPVPEITVHVTIATDDTAGAEPPAATVHVERSSTGPGTVPAPVTRQLTVLAHDGAIVKIGPGALTANTGDTASSGVVAIDPVDSTLTTGQSTYADGGARTTAGVVRSQPPLVSNEVAPHLGDRAVAIAGYENHSVNVAGNDQIVTYDDSNVFIDRSGVIEANSGDTDSSGLNAMDVVRSFVRSGDSGDDEDDSEEPEDPEDPDEDAAPAATRAALSSTAVPVAGSASVVDDDAATSASDRDPLVIGGDGYDDLGIRSAGDRNVVTYDDSNVVIGGTGDAHAQIGDSDTGGAVVMRIVDSHVEAGNAF